MEEKKKIRKSVQLNRKARHDYELLDQFNAGIELFGTEIKSIRKGNANLRDSYILVRSGEVFWIGGYIAPYEQGNRNNHDPDRTRKLLLKKYSTESLNNPTPAILDKRRMGPEGKPVSLYFGEYAAQERQRRARSQAEADQFLLEQKITRLKEDTI